jgi:hypothetical protein
MRPDPKYWTASKFREATREHLSGEGMALLKWHLCGSHYAAIKVRVECSGLEKNGFASKMMGGFHVCFDLLLAPERVTKSLNDLDV